MYPILAKCQILYCRNCALFKIWDVSDDGRLGKTPDACDHWLSGDGECPHDEQIVKIFKSLGNYYYLKKSEEYKSS